ncbi:hypothetical protein ACFWU5_15075 [Nocardia sp. NPDC058640]|uniref:hypothetical protein n=1 Tax=Nocardia sp. NPDC058640 TaxID=3346571 RepID=UPI00365401A5
MTITPPSPADPTQLGRFRVLGLLDPQPNFRVLLAAAPDGSLRVVEQVLPGLLEQDDLRIRFRHGAVSAMRVGGPGNAAVLDVDADDEMPWLARTFTIGMRLDRAVAEFGPLPVEAVRALAFFVAQALQGVHAAGLVHQRVRPDTVSLTRDGIELVGVDVLGDSGSAPPDYLSPEQSVRSELTSAADVFALGSVLAFAAGAVAPFTAPSVPYTLFNIAQREPDLAAVPEQLRELIAACLRKDPRSRPSPAQIIAYVGAQRPEWPSAVIEEIDSTAGTVAGLLDAAQAQIHTEDTEPDGSRFDSMVRASADFARDRYAWTKSRIDASSSRARRALVVSAAVLMLVVTSGLYWLVQEGDGSKVAPPVGISLAELRQIDSCAWLRSALGDSVALKTGPTPIASWRFDVEKQWGCYADQEQLVNGDGMRLELGVDLRDVPPNRKVVDGVTVLEGAQYCGRAIASTDDDGRSGILFELDKSFAEQHGCAIADRVIADLARTLRTAPRSADAAISLAAVDPCGLVDRAALSAAFSRLTPRPTTHESVHQCRWYGSRVLIVDFSREFVFSREAAEPEGSVVVDGITLRGANPMVGATDGCSRTYRHRALDEKRYETVKLSVSGPDVDRAANCQIAESLLVQVVRQLPKI